MCGIVGIFNIKSQSQELRNKALRMAQKIRHRGPDWSGIYVGGSAILVSAQERNKKGKMNSSRYQWRQNNYCTCSRTSLQKGK